MKFSIFEIKAGWFEVMLNDQIIITNSYYMGNDAPRILIKNLVQMFSLESGIIRLCWQDEPGALIWKFEVNNGKVNTKILDCNIENTYKLQYEGRSLDVFDDSEIFFEAKDSLYNLALNVYHEFKNYSNGDMLKHYEKEWMPFPHEELNKLGDILKSKRIK